MKRTCRPVTEPTQGLLDDARDAVRDADACAPALPFIVFDEGAGCGVQLVLDCDAATYARHADALEAFIREAALEREFGRLTRADDPDDCFVGFSSDEVVCALMPDLLDAFGSELRRLGLIRDHDVRRSA